jgi:acyl dehydratase
MLDRSVLGRTSAEAYCEVERGAIRRFAEALGDYNLIFFDHTEARNQGYPAIVAPPTFPLSWAVAGPLIEALKVPPRALMLAECSIEYERPLYAGDQLRVISKVAEIEDRPSATGRVEVAVIEDEGRDPQGQLVYRLRRTLAVRASKGGL